MERPSSHKPSRIPFAERLTCTIAEAAEATGMTTRTIYRRIDAGDLAALKQGGRRLVRIPSLLQLLGLEAPQ